jgi:hypothetical protein
MLMTSCWRVSKADPINRHFFSAGVDVRGNLPQSLLSTVYYEVVMSIVLVPHHVPLGAARPGQC